MLGQQRALTTRAALPLTVTSTGDLTTWTFASASGGKGLPGSRLGQTGPSPLTLMMSISPARAGFSAVTGEKSSPW